VSSEAIAYFLPFFKSNDSRNEQKIR